MLLALLVVACILPCLADRGQTISSWYDSSSTSQVRKFAEHDQSSPPTSGIHVGVAGELSRVRKEAAQEHPHLQTASWDGVEGNEDEDTQQNTDSDEADSEASVASWDKSDSAAEWRPNRQRTSKFAGWNGNHNNLSEGERLVKEARKLRQKQHRRKPRPRVTRNAHRHVKRTTKTTDKEPVQRKPPAHKLAKITKTVTAARVSSMTKKQMASIVTKALAMIDATGGDKPGKAHAAHAAHKVAQVQAALKKALAQNGLLSKKSSKPSR
mmetsp:Transcript_529/g.1033  ORF Transcript_529/g.1033 Transcript_529/m.1033 type:complete len:268 (+) Transcript_529:3-806(+)